uniref:Uncharacterized protein n=1 Tax=Peronospora matthiolae TaxID=2874970 RepID=A0AAV1U3E3_9STRA
MRTRPTFYVGQPSRTIDTLLLPMKNALALKHLAESLVLQTVGIDKSLKSIHLIPRPINNPTSYP